MDCAIMKGAYNLCFLDNNINGMLMPARFGCLGLSVPLIY